MKLCSILAMLLSTAGCETRQHDEPAALALTPATGATAPAAVGVVPPAPVRITMQQVLFDTTAKVVSNGVPLPPGTLGPADARFVRVFVGGTERAAYVEALAGTHPDGSLQAVLVQFAAVPGATDGELVIGESRTMTRGKAPTAPIPDAAFLPAEPDYLVRTLLVGPTLTRQAASRLVPEAAKYDADFATFSERHWREQKDAWGENYYDRAQAYIAQWVRTGNPGFWLRGLRQAVSWRRDYLEANAYGTSPHWSQVDGMGLHYWLTGDEGSRLAVGRIAETLRYFRDRAAWDIPDIEGRILARTLMAQLWGWRLNAKGSESIVSAAELDSTIARVLKRQAPNGAWTFSQSICAPHAGTLAYMDGMLAEALIQAHAFRPSPGIPRAVQRSADFLWTQWDVARQGFKYAPGCPAAEHNVGVAELNGLNVNAFAWTWQQTGEPRYRQRADSLFRASVRHQFLQGSKQFNQQYSVSFRYLAWRGERGAP